MATAKKTIKKMNKKPVKSSSVKAGKTAIQKKAEKTVSKTKTVSQKAVAPKKRSLLEADKTVMKKKKAVLSSKNNKAAEKIAEPKKPLNTSKKKLSPRETKIQQIKMKLLHQKEMLLNEAEEALNELPGQTIFPDLGDQASAETDRNFMLRLRGREQRLLKKIDQALERVETGIFGICEDCGNEINIQRLEARPVTTMCIDCKTLQEEEERLRES
jgi:DnaK suppressor protein